MTNIIPLSFSKKPKHLPLQCEVIEFRQREEEPELAWWAKLILAMWGLR